MEQAHLDRGQEQAVVLEEVEVEAGAAVIVPAQVQPATVFVRGAGQKCHISAACPVIPLIVLNAEQGWFDSNSCNRNY